MNNTPRKVLIVEDSELLQTSYSLLFPLLFQRHRAEGCEIVRAMNGEEGLRRLTEHPDCDLIVLDINMPVMSGLEFLEHCKGVSLFADIPVIICSTEGEQHPRQRGVHGNDAARQGVGGLGARQGFLSGRTNTPQNEERDPQTGFGETTHGHK